MWRDEPNDWVSQFKAVGPSWTFDPTTEQYYLHSFMAEQPDLNWDNPEVEAAMHDVLRFWMDRGVDGLRLDAIHKIAKDPQLRDHIGAPRRHDEDWESIHDRLRGIRKVIDEYEDRMIVGEVALQDLHRIVAYLGYGDQLHLAHNFVFIDQEWDAETYATSIADFEKLADGSLLAGLVPRQPRQAAPRQPLQPRRPRPATGERDPGDALRAPRHAVHLPGRGAGPPGRPHPAGPHRRRRRPRPRTSADAVDRRTPELRLHAPATRGCHSSPKRTPSMQEPKLRIRAPR